jgi:oligoendopeptidase F
MNRADVDPAYTWDAQSIFASDAEWEAAVGELHDGMTAFGRFRTDLSADAGRLVDGLLARDALTALAGKILIYGPDVLDRGYKRSESVSDDGPSARTDG